MSPLASRLVRAGVLTAISDGLFSSVLSVVFYHSTVSRVFQGVASTLLGPSAFDGGTRTTLIGIGMHIGVAFGWSAVFLLAVRQSAVLRRAVTSRYGPVKVAAVFGPLIWTVMSLIVIPALLHRPPAINARWWVQFIGQFPFAGLPIVAMIRDGSAKTTTA